jgi:hypothetical protein
VTTSTWEVHAALVYTGEAEWRTHMGAIQAAVCRHRYPVFLFFFKPRNWLPAGTDGPSTEQR